MPATPTYSPLPLQTQADCLQPYTCRYARYAEINPVQPLKGLRETRAVSVSYLASVPAGHGGCGIALFYRALAPHGATLPFRITTTHSVVPQFILNSEILILNWTFTFSAKERDPETGLSYFGSRYYSSDLSIWLSVDPMSDQYPYQSGYVYCGNNPIKVIDPNGEDEWEFDECGVLKNVIVNNDVDVVHIVNENGARIATSERFTYGTLFNEEDDAAYENDYFPSLTLFQVSDFESTEAIYKFLADNTSVEWGNVCAEDEERNCLFFIGSNHDESSTNIRKTIFERGYTIDREVHNHPSGNPELSERDHQGAVAAITNNPCVQLYLYVTPLLNLKRYDKGTQYWNNEGVLQIPANKR